MIFPQIRSTGVLVVLHIFNSRILMPILFIFLSLNKVIDKNSYRKIKLY